MNITLQDWIPFIICAVSAIFFLTHLIINTIKESKKQQNENKCKLL